MAPDGIVEFHPDAQNNPYLRAGQYGPNMLHNADCEIVLYEFPTTKRPMWDQQEKENLEDWARMDILVRSEKWGAVRVFADIRIGKDSRTKLPVWLTAIGVPVEGETFRHNTGDVVGRKCGVEIGDPYTRKDGSFGTGNLLDMFGV
jgi:hypothetical protein